MGAWGSGILEDDTALDFLEELRSGDDAVELAREALAEAGDAKYLEYDAGQAALVSAAIVDAVLHGTSLGADVEGLAEWLGGLQAAEWAPLREDAARGCLRVIGSASELQELWSENEEEFPRWRRQIETLAARLVGHQ